MNNYALRQVHQVCDELGDRITTIATSTDKEALNDYCLKNFGIKAGKPEKFSWVDYYIIEETDVVIVNKKEDEIFTIKNIEQGGIDNRDDRRRLIYAVLEDQDGYGRISATLDYILLACVKRNHKVTNLSHGFNALIKHYNKYIDGLEKKKNIPVNKGKEDINEELRLTQKVLHLTLSDEERKAFKVMLEVLIATNKTKFSRYSSSSRKVSQAYYEGKCDAYNNMYKMFDLQGDEVEEFTNLIINHE